MKDIIELKSEDLKKIRQHTSKGLRPGEWRLMPLTEDETGDFTSWDIFELEPGQPVGGDTMAVTSIRSQGIPYWAGLEIVRAHNKALGFYDGD